MVSTEKLLTIEEFQTEFAGQRVELVRGVPQPMTPTSFKHGTLSNAIAHYLTLHVFEHNLGSICGAETGFVLSGDPPIVRAADAAFVAAERVQQIEDLDRFAPFAPNLAAEVVSPSDKAGDIKAKVNEYLAAGTRLVWVIYPDQQQIDTFTMDGQTETLNIGDTLTGGDVLPGFSLPLARLFEVK